MSPGIQVFWERVGVCAGLFFFCERDVCERDAREACAACRRGFVGGWLLGCRESAPLLQSPSTGSTRLTGWLFRAVGECGCSGDRIRAVGECGCLGGWIRAVGEGGCLGGWIRVRLSGAPGVG